MIWIWLIERAVGLRKPPVPSVLPLETPPTSSIFYDLGQGLVTLHAFCRIGRLVSKGFLVDLVSVSGNVFLIGGLSLWLMNSGTALLTGCILGCVPSLKSKHRSRWLVNGPLNGRRACQAPLPERIPRRGCSWK